MRVLVVGATGVIGRRLVPLLVGAGHSVTGTTRSPAKAEALRAAGATPVVVDVFDAGALLAVLATARSEVILHQLTDLPDHLDSDQLENVLARNARMRAEGTRNLVEAAVQKGARRLVAQSIAWVYAPGPQPHDEEDALDLGAEGSRALTVHGVFALERLVTSTTSLEGLVLRNGRFYGPGTWAVSPDGEVSVHVDAAAWAALLTVERGLPGVYNVVDDGVYARNIKAH
jgi:nucleoside-diphosphate-sugar epimerase